MKKGIIRIFISVAVISSWLMLTGSVFSDVKLNTTKPLIDLGTEVGDSKPGHGGNTDTGLTGEIEDDTEGEAVVTIRISIMGTSMMLNGNTVTETSLKPAVSKLYEEGMEVYLVDNYADAKTYKNALDILNEMKLSPVLEQTD